LSTITLLLTCSILAIFGLAKYYPKIGKESIFFIADFSNGLAKIDTANLLLPLVLLAISTILLCTWKRGWLNRNVFQGLVLALIIFDLFAIGINHNPTFDADIAFPDTASLDFMQKLKVQTDEPFRIVNISSDSILPGMAPELYALQAVSGYSSWVLRRYSDFANLTTEREPSSINYVYFEDCCHPLLDALNIAYVYSSSEIPPTNTGTLNLISALPNAQIDTSNASNVHTTEWTINGVTHPVLYAHPPTRISYPLDINQPAVFKTAIAIDPSTWDKNGDGVLFEALVSEDETNTEKVLFSRYLNPKVHSADKAWVPVEIDLSQFSGKQIKLTLKTAAGPESNASYDWAGWALPQIENYYPRTLELIYDGPNKVYKNLKSLPRAWVVHDVTEVDINDTESVKKTLSAADFDPRTEAVIEGRLDTELGIAHEDDQVKVTAYSDERVELEVNIKEPGLLVLSDVMYPGWNVYVDGVEQPIITANLIMRGVFLPEGNHRVVFVFKPVLLFIGLLFSGIALLIILIALIWPVRRSIGKAHP